MVYNPHSHKKAQPKPKKSTKSKNTSLSIPVSVSGKKSSLNHSRYYRSIRNNRSTMRYSRRSARNNNRRQRQYSRVLDKDFKQSIDNYAKFVVEHIAKQDSIDINDSHFSKSFSLSKKSFSKKQYSKGIIYLLLAFLTGSVILNKGASIKNAFGVSHTLSSKDAQDIMGGILKYNNQRTSSDHKQVVATIEAKIKEIMSIRDSPTIIDSDSIDRSDNSSPELYRWVGIYNNLKLVPEKHQQSKKTHKPTLTNYDKKILDFLKLIKNNPYSKPVNLENLNASVIGSMISKIVN